MVGYLFRLSRSSIVVNQVACGLDNFLGDIEQRCVFTAFELRTIFFFSLGCYVNWESSSAER